MSALRRYSLPLAVTAVIGGSLVALTGAAQPSRAPAIAALGQIEPGQWQLRERKGTQTVGTRRLCVADAASLLQIRHSGANCSRYVIENTPKSATVHYTCPGAGHGRTSIRVENPRLVQIASQGIADNAPFDVALEGRRLGDCEPARQMR
jgi:hypothetical protein